MFDLAVNWSAIMPHIILCAVGSLILVGAAGREERVGKWGLWVAILGVLAAMVSAWMLRPGEPAFAGSVAVDGVSRILYLVLCLSALLTLCFTAGYEQRAVGSGKR